MEFKNIRPVTPSRRHLTRINKSHLNRKPALKFEVIGKKNSTGKSSSGSLTAFHRGGGSKKNYRKIDFERRDNSTGIICTIEYDPNRRGYIASVFDFLANHFYYILAPKNLKTGDIIKSGVEIEPSLGSSLPISKIPVGCSIYALSLNASKPAQASRSAGVFSVVKEKTRSHAVVQLGSRERRRVSIECFASIGETSNELHFLTRLGKAGCSRWVNRRPRVRGVAMNPVDHPHGGGEGKKSGNAKSPWGKPNKKKKLNKIR